MLSYCNGNIILLKYSFSNVYLWLPSETPAGPFALKKLSKLILKKLMLVKTLSCHPQYRFLINLLYNKWERLIATKFPNQSIWCLVVRQNWATEHKLKILSSTAITFSACRANQKIQKKCLLVALQTKRDFEPESWQKVIKNGNAEWAGVRETLEILRKGWRERLEFQFCLRNIVYKLQEMLSKMRGRIMAMSEWGKKKRKI